MEPGGSLPHSQQPATCPYPVAGAVPKNQSRSEASLFRNIIFFLRWGVVSTSPNPQAGGPPPVGCPRMLIQYIRSYPS
jgi:hypothetical protein